jgi:O-antigen/teichoic acid export membrane protein
VREGTEGRADDGGRRSADGPGSDSLFKNAYFLMLSTGVSAVLGLGFWLVAARYYAEDAVGQGSAAIAAMRLLASITATTMIGAVVRFVPRAGRATGALVRRVYVASSVVVAAVAGIFLLTLDRWGSSYAPLGAPAAGALFVAACVAWALLTLQDGVLTGLRKAEWVPVGNAVFSVGKLVLLAVFATVLPVLGIFVSWAVAIAFSTLPLGWLVFRRLIPRQAARDRDVEPPEAREMGRFLAGDSLGALFSLAMINLLPVMIAVNFTAAENGYFYVAYTVGGTMEFMAINMASSLTAHASHDPRRLADGVRGALRRMTLLLVPVVLVLVLFAPRILAPFDEDYATHGSTVLRLLALGALPRIVVELYIGVLRVQGRTGVLAAVQGAMCALVLSGAGLLFGPAGIAGAGWAVLGGMTLVAAGCVPGLRAALRGPSEPGAGAPGGGGRTGADAYGTRWARLNATAGYGTNWARRAAYERGPSGGRDARRRTHRPYAAGGAAARRARRRGSPAGGVRRGGDPLRPARALAARRRAGLRPDRPVRGTCRRRPGTAAGGRGVVLVDGRISRGGGRARRPRRVAAVGAGRPAVAVPRAAVAAARARGRPGVVAGALGGPVSRGGGRLGVAAGARSGRPAPLPAARSARPAAATPPRTGTRAPAPHPTRHRTAPRHRHRHRHRTAPRHR